MKQLIQDNEIKELKQYIQEYFVKLAYPIGVLHWVPSEKQAIFYTFPEVKSLFIKKIQIGNFNLQKWYFEENTDLYYQTLDVSQGPVFEKQGQQYVNLFKGPLYVKQKKYANFPAEVKEGVDFIWNHVFEVLCSKKRKVFHYVQQWIAHAVSGRKMRTCLYLKSCQGTGKSIITEFLEEMVLGRNLVLITQNPKCILGGFNYQLAGKTILVLEEAPTVTKGQWLALENSLKPFITNSRFEMERKNKDPMVVDNLLSVIVITNNNAIRISSDDRRYVVLDVSPAKVGDHEYFSKLAAYTRRKDVGEAFYWWCKEFAEKNKKFNESIRPETVAKQEMILENLHSVYKYLKECFLLKRKGIERQLYKDFRREYGEYCYEKKIEPISEYEVRQRLLDLGIKLIEGNGHKRYIEVPFDTLLKIFKDKHWIHEIDEFEENGPTEDIQFLGQEEDEEKEAPKIEINEKKFNLIDTKYMKQGLEQLEMLESNKTGSSDNGCSSEIVDEVADEVAALMQEIEKERKRS